MRESRKPMVRGFGTWLVPLAALALMGSLAGCVAYPAYPGYAYGYGPGYGYSGYGYAPAPVVVGGGWGWGRGWHDGGWRRRW